MGGPIGVETKWVDGKLRMKATVVGLRGDVGVDCEETEAVTTYEGADEFGKRIAQELVNRGAGKILADITASRQVPETVK